MPTSTKTCSSGSFAALKTNFLFYFCHRFSMIINDQLLEFSNSKKCAWGLVPVRRQLYLVFSFERTIHVKLINGGGGDSLWVVSIGVFLVFYYAFSFNGLYSHHRFKMYLPLPQQDRGPLTEDIDNRSMYIPVNHANLHSHTTFNHGLYSNIYLETVLDS